MHLSMRTTRKYVFRCLCLITGGCLISLFVASNLHFTKPHNKPVDDILVKIYEHAIRYPQEPYIVIPNVLTASLENNAFDDNELIICTQTSLSNLYSILNLSEKWDGKLSVALFSFGNEVSLALHSMILMKKCSKDVRDKVSFHLVYPLSSPPISLTSMYNMDFVNCNALRLIRKLDVGENYALQLPYPENVLRNVAMMFSKSTYVLNLDVDFVPSKGMKNEMETFLRNRTHDEKQKKLAYITPTFESNITFSEPLSKKELIVAVKNGSVRQLGVKKCIPCQSASNYSRWLSLPYPSTTTVSYYVKFRMTYEPIYIADREHLPMFDSRFKQYGFDRSSQLCETHYSGYDFAVMNNHFVVHDGFKDPKQFFKWKQEENLRNAKLFRKIVLPYFKMKYPDSTRKC